MANYENFAELERIEDKYIVNLEDLPAIKKEIEKNLKPSYTEPKTQYVLINSVYMDSKYRDFFRLHVYGASERTKVRFRKYGPNGIWDDSDVFLEIKEKSQEDVYKSRIKLDPANLKNVNSGKAVVCTEELEEINKDMYEPEGLQAFVERYNKLRSKHDLKPVLSVTYKRLAYGKDKLRVTIDTNLSYVPMGVLSLSDSIKIRKSVDWDVVKEYKNKYQQDNTAILEIKHEANHLPPWLVNLLDKYNMKPEKFSKYVWASSHNLNMMDKIS